MIKKLTIKNFQSHENTEITFSSQVNVITGRSQSGKTAILRALNWLVTSRPRGFRYNSYFADSGTLVRMELNDGHVSHLKAGKNKKEGFVLNKKRVFEGSAVPDEVTRVLNLTEINMQGQLDQPFLITSSPGEITRVINDVTGLDKVDKWVSTLTSLINALNKKITFIKEDIDKTETALQHFDGLEKLEKPIIDLEVLQKQINYLDDDIQTLEIYIENLKEVEEQIKLLDWVDEAELAFKELNKIQADIETTESLIAVNNKIEVLDEQIASIEEIETLFKELLDVRTWLYRVYIFDASIGDIETIDNEIRVLEQEIVKHNLDYGRILYKAGKCPVCFSDMDEEALERVANEL